MPNIRIMNWNIEQLSWNKVRMGNMTDVLAQTVVAQNIDILVVVEVRSANVNNIMETMSASLNNLAGGNNYLGWFISYETGGEFYGFFIRDLDVIRPVEVTAGPGGGAAQPPGSSNYPLVNLKESTFESWPTNDWNTSAYPIPGGRPQLPLIDAYATPYRNRRAKKKAQFAGGAIAQGGYSLGRGFRRPCVAMFMVHSAAVDYLIPIVCCHYAAVRGGRNILGQSQVAQLGYLHIAQLFNDYDAGGATSGYIDIDGAAVQIQELMFTGDFNLDFLENNVMGSITATTNRMAYDSLTPTIQNGGSAAPAADPAAAGPVPMVPFAPPFLPGPTTSDIQNQALKAAATTQGTILVHYDPLVAPPNTDALKGACFDNFLFGGTQMSATVQINFGVGNVDASDVIDTPANIVQQGGAVAAGDLDLSLIAAAYVVKGTKNAAAAPNLQAAGGGLTVNDRLLGARLLSDHLPTVVQYNLP